MSEKKIVCPDPDCNTENDAEAEACSKCKLDLASFFTLDRVLSIREKAARHAEAERIQKEKDNAPQASRGGLAGLIRRKK